MNTDEALDYLAIVGCVWSLGVLLWREYHRLTYHTKIRRIRERLVNWS